MNGEGRARAAACGLALLAVAVAGCARRTISVGGLVVHMSSDGTLRANLTNLHVEIGPAGDGGAYVARDYAMPSQATLPASIGIESNGAASSVVIDVSVWSGDRPLDVRRYEVDVPTTRVRDVDVIFSARCSPYAIVRDGQAVSTCGDASTCDPRTGACASDVFGEPGEVDATTSDGPVEAPSNDAPDAHFEDAGRRTRLRARRGDAVQRRRRDAAAMRRRAVAGPAAMPPDPAVLLAGSLPAGAPELRRRRLVAVRQSRGPRRNVLPSFDDAGSRNTSWPATVHGFRLDTYEVNLGRFTAFENAVDLGWLPEAGAGTHVHLNGGNGLVVAMADGGPAYEPGWDPSWTSSLATNSNTWLSNLYCTPYAVDDRVSRRTAAIRRTASPGTRPTPSASGTAAFSPPRPSGASPPRGAQEQRIFPWGPQDPGRGPAYAAWGCFFGAQGLCTMAATDIAYVDQLPAGVGLWGQFNLAGNMAEWTLDGYQSSVPDAVHRLRGAGYGAEGVSRRQLRSRRAVPLQRVSRVW